jgi:hypothetical protein
MRVVRSPVAFGRLAGLRIAEALAHPGTYGYGNSPNQSLSSFAGNELLVSPDGLVEDGRP